MNLQEMDLGTVPPAAQSGGAGQGRLERVRGLLDKSVPNTNPYGNFAIRADGLAAWDGRPTNPRIEALRGGGSTPATLMSCGGSVPSFRCSFGRMYPTSR
jgi:hypothetical protein